MFKLFLMSVFMSFMLAKITKIKEFLVKGGIKEDSLSNILNKINEILIYLKIENIKAREIFDFGKGYEGTAHILNYLITYTPIFFIVLLSIYLIYKILKFLFIIFKKIIGRKSDKK